jgi:hypothetical protein
MKCPTVSARQGRWPLVLRPAALALVVALAPFAASPAFAEETAAAASDATDAQGETTLEELEEKIRVLAEEIADMKTDEAVPDAVDPTEGFYGLGPGASKVYRRDKGLSVGGYGDVRFQHFTKNDDGEADVFDALRLVLYTGYKFNDWLVFNSEVEFEHGSTEDAGAVSVEFLTVDFLLEPYFNIRSGLVLVPMGFLNEVHEPPFYFGAERPEVERRIIPSTWRENGVGGFGSFDFGDAGDLHWRMYGVNGFDATGFDAKGLRGGRQNGSEALADDWGFVARLDYEPGPALPGFLVGGSVYYGKSGQNQTSDATGSDLDVPSTPVHIYELHAQYRGYGVSLRGLWAQAFVDDAGRLSTVLDLAADESVAKQMIGGYAEVAYNVLNYVDTNMSLEPFFRYEYLDTQHKVASGFVKDNNLDYDLYVYGFSYKPIPQVVVKFDYRDFRAKEGSLRDEIQASIGFVF